tara:strand:+ start:838 stop:1191 length:354 start_codon:yes stop_codon:yes gene_type:complete
MEKNLLFSKRDKTTFQAPMGRIDFVKAELTLKNYKSESKRQKEQMFNSDYEGDPYEKNWIHANVKGFQQGNPDKKKVDEGIFDKTLDGKDMKSKKKKDKISKLSKAFVLKNGKYHEL